MKKLMVRYFYYIVLSVVISGTASVRTMAGDCSVSDGSKLPSVDGCLLAFVYNQTGDHRLVVLDEQSRRRYEVPLDNAKCAPFWEGGKVYVVDVSGSVQGFSIGADKLIAEKTETISIGAVRTAEYDRSQHRLYLIRTQFDGQGRISYTMSAIYFPNRRTVWTKVILAPGLLAITPPYICMRGLGEVQVFNCDTGEKLGGIDAVKVAATAVPSDTSGLTGPK